MAHKHEKFLWMDMEMTGLDPVNDRVTEVAAIVTDENFKELDTYESLVHQPEKVLDRMKEAPFYDWSSGRRVKTGTVYDVAKANGLIDKMAEAPNEDVVEQEFADFIAKNFNKPAVIAGNSIHQDRRFIRQWWPKVEELLHYRIVDVSSFKIILADRYRWNFAKDDNHRALDDVRESIAELEFYLKKINP